MQYNQKGIYLGLGSNIGDKKQNILTAYDHILEHNCKILKKSSFYSTPPWGFDSDVFFYNTVIKIETEIKPIELLAVLKNIEHDMGRKEKSTKGYASRIIDIDILDYRSEILKSEKLTIPHQHISKRNFVVVPLMEIAPNWIHPISKDSIYNMVLRVKAETIELINNA